MEEKNLEQNEELVQDAEIIEEEVTNEEEVTENEGEVEGDLPPWMSFLVGVRGKGLYQSKTNLTETTVSDYSEALAAIDMNITLLMLKNLGIESVETFFKFKEILAINAVRELEGKLDQIGITQEQYQQLRGFFGLDQIEELIEQRKQEFAMVDEEPQETEESKEEVKIEI